MTQSNLEREIMEAATEFALQVVESVKRASLDELINLKDLLATQEIKRGPGRPPKNEFRRGPGRPPKDGVRRGPGRPPKQYNPDEEISYKRKRVVKNYPKCAFPDCENNRFPRGKGFCGEHWREFEAGKIESSDFYRNKTEDQD